MDRNEEAQRAKAIIMKDLIRRINHKEEFGQKNGVENLVEVQ